MLFLQTTSRRRWKCTLLSSPSWATLSTFPDSSPPVSQIHSEPVRKDSPPPPPPVLVFSCLWLSLQRRGISEAARTDTLNRALGRLCSPSLLPPRSAAPLVSLPPGGWSELRDSCPQWVFPGATVGLAGLGWGEFFPVVPSVVADEKLPRDG